MSSLVRVVNEAGTKTITMSSPKTANALSLALVEGSLPQIIGRRPLKGDGARRTPGETKEGAAPWRTEGTP